MATRERGYIDRNVLDEAKRRIHDVYEQFDTVAVAFSGGKDSLAVLHLAKEVRDERGITKPIPVIFRDEELIPDTIIDFVASYRELDWVDLRWYCVPLESNQFVLGTTTRYVQWDPNREHVRPMPEWAIKLEDLDLPPDLVVDQYSADEITARGLKGRVAVLNGIRAAESLNRYRGVMASGLKEPHITAAGSSKKSRIFLVKPLYDWEENDIFRYFYDRGIAYCPVYDAQLWSKTALRVSTPLHAEAAKHFDKLRANAPTLYAQIIELFPEMLVQERYWAELDQNATREQYLGEGLDGVERWVMDNLSDQHQRRKALRELARIKATEKRRPGQYPADYVLAAFVGGQYKRQISPQPKSRQKETTS